MTSANLTRAETSARAAVITLDSVEVVLDLTDAANADGDVFGTTTTLRFAAAAEETWLDFLGAGVDEVIVNGAGVPVDYDGARIRIVGLAARNEVRVVARGRYSRSGEGLHRFVDPVDGETYLYTQYEPADSRRVMACFEQPDMKARFSFTVRAPSEWQVLSNQPLVTRAEAGTSQTVRFAPTPPLSSYITAVAAGPYHRVTGAWDRGDQHIDLGVLCRASLAEHLEAEEILEVTRQGLDFYDDAFAFPYPWGKYDQIFVPEYNLGAMENPGLVTFTEAYVFRGAATRAQRAGRANTILHEMAHMWFGDLVTMRWWDDLWLKESFADYMGSHASAAATRYTDAWVTFANRRKAWAYQQDQLPTTHPIVADIPDLEAAKLNFDGITYAKGAAVLKQLVAFVGEDAFFAGARRYFAVHAYGNTTLEDLLVELEAASGRDVRSWARSWLQTTGVSTLRAERDEDGLMLVQSDPRPHRLRLGRYALENGRIVLSERVSLEVSGERTRLDVADDDLLLLNDGDLSYVKARLDDRSLRTVEQALQTIDDDLVRGLVWSSLWNATRDGEMSVRRYLRIVGLHAPAEPHAGLLSGVLANAAFAIGHFLDGPARAECRHQWAETVAAALDAAEAGSDGQLSWARAFAAASADDPSCGARVRALLSGETPAGLQLDPDLRWALWTALATTGDATAAELDEESARDGSARGRMAALQARTSFPDARTRDEGWDRAWADDAVSNEELDAIIAGVRAGGRRDLLIGHDADYFTRIATAWATRSIEIARRLVIGLFPASESLDVVDAWLNANSDAPAALRRIVIEQRDHLSRDLRVRASQRLLD